MKISGGTAEFSGSAAGDGAKLAELFQTARRVTFSLLRVATRARNLAVGSRVVRLGQPVLDAIDIAKHVEHVGTPLSGRPDTVLR